MLLYCLSDLILCYLRVIFVGHEGDESKTPAWAKDGSFMVFRIYEQLVPEFYQ